MIRKNLVSLTTLSAGLTLFAQSAERPNIIHIMTDDHSFRALTAYDGIQYGHTPNLDKLAREGVLFHKSYVTNSISSPSRAVLLTGKHSHMNKKKNNSGLFDGKQQTIPKLLQQGGYTTAIIGKWHLESLPTGFDHFEILPGQGHYYNPDFIQMDSSILLRRGYCTDLITDMSLEWIGKVKDEEKPFALYMHHKAPHRNWMPSTKYLDYYEDVTYPLPGNFYDSYEGKSPAAKTAEMRILNHLNEAYDLKISGVKPEKWQMAEFKDIWSRMDRNDSLQLRNYYNNNNVDYQSGKLQGKERDTFVFNRYIKDYIRTIASVDESVGRLMDYLKKEGLDKNTLIVYTSDQSFYLGEHGWYDKRFMYEESFRTPIIIWYPEKIKPRVDKKNLVQNLDFGSTFLDYAGIDIPHDIQGVSMRPILENKNAKWRKSIYYHYYGYPEIHQVRKHYGVKTNRYKLIHFYGEPKRKGDEVIDYWEMYDNKKDTFEMNNIYNNPKSRKQQKTLHKELNRLRELYKVPEDK
jgi:arylsulfatase A-like enzyme